MAITRVDDKIDIRGLICPYTLMQTRDKLKTMSQGQVLEVLCDYEPAATQTIPAFCEKKGYPLDMSQSADSLWQLRIKKTD